MMVTDRKHIGIYSGSFNPIHKGHLSIARYMIDQKLVDELWLVVSPCNPLKDSQDQLDEQIRLRMVELAIADCPSIKACDIEFTMPIPSYSIDTLNKLSLLHPNCQLSLIIGSDNAIIFNKWKNYQQILDNYRIFVYPRTAYPIAEVLSLYPQMQEINAPVIDVSSTEIRNAVRQKQSYSHWLDASVADFIVLKNLYLSDNQNNI